MMGIDVANHLWVAVCAASYVAQQERRVREGRGPAVSAESDALLDEARAVADEAIESFDRLNPEDYDVLARLDAVLGKEAGDE